MLVKQTLNLVINNKKRVRHCPHIVRYPIYCIDHMF